MWEELVAGSKARGPEELLSKAVEMKPTLQQRTRNAEKARSQDTYQEKLSEPAQERNHVCLL